jgi:hypothetical protein
MLRERDGPDPLFLHGGVARRRMGRHGFRTM